MIGEGIHKGDTLIIQKEEKSIAFGSLYVLRLNCTGEIVVRTIDSFSTDGTVMLGHAMKRKGLGMWLGQDDIQIEGRVIAVQRPVGGVR